MLALLVEILLVLLSTCGIDDLEPRNSLLWLPVMSLLNAHWNRVFPNSSRFILAASLTIIPVGGNK